MSTTEMVVFGSLIIFLIIVVIGIVAAEFFDKSHYCKKNRQSDGFDYLDHVSSKADDLDVQD